MVFKTAGQKYFRMLQESFLQYFLPSLFKLSFVFMTFVYFEQPLTTGFTVHRTDIYDLDFFS